MEPDKSAEHQRIGMGMGMETERERMHESAAMMVIMSENEIGRGQAVEVMSGIPVWTEIETETGIGTERKAENGIGREIGIGRVSVTQIVRESQIESAGGPGPGVEVTAVSEAKVGGAEVEAEAEIEGEGEAGVAVVAVVNADKITWRALIREADAVSQMHRMLPHPRPPLPSHLRQHSCSAISPPIRLSKHYWTHCAMHCHTVPCLPTCVSYVIETREKAKDMRSRSLKRLIRQHKWSMRYKTGIIIKDGRGS